MSLNMEVSETTVPEQVNEQPAAPGYVDEEPSQPTQQRPLLVDVPVENENVALNILVGFLNLAQRRGSFNFKESAKIAECIDMFVQGPGGSESN